MKFETKAIHIGEEPDFRPGAYGDVSIPIHLSTTFARLDIDKPTGGYEYSRTGNPTRNALELKLAAIENARYALAFSSGLAAESTVLFSLIKPGDNIVAFNDLYGGTRRLLDKIFKEEYGINTIYVDATDPTNVAKVLNEKTRLVYLETPTNPLLKLADIKEISRICNEKEILVAVDNTFASPYFQNPLDLGADIVIHSTTKYINGHSDAVGGAVMMNNKELYEELKFHQNSIGAILPPFDSYLVLRGIKTLGLRMEKHEKNALEIAKYLESHKKIERVYYPGLKSHAQYKLALKQMKGFGGMLSFVLKGGSENVLKFLKGLKFFSLAESLGGVESLIEVPSLMTHKGLNEDEKRALGIVNNLVRVSVGIENTEDLIDDLENSLSRIS